MSALFHPMSPEDAYALALFLAYTISIALSGAMIGWVAARRNCKSGSDRKPKPTEFEERLVRL